VSGIGMAIGDLMRGFVESYLPWPVEEIDMETRDKTALVMSLSLSVSVDPEGITNMRRVHLMFHRYGSYVKVLWAVVNPDEVDYVGHYDDVDVWTMKSDHDSAWVNDGIEMPFDALAKEMLNEIDPKAKLWDKDCVISLYFSPFGMVPKLVRLKGYELNRENRTFTVEFEPRS